VTGVQMNEGRRRHASISTFPMRTTIGWRALEGELNEVVQQDLAVVGSYVSMAVAEATKDCCARAR